MRVVAFPAYRNRRSNPYNYLLYKACGNFDIDIVEFNLFELYFGKSDIIHVHWPEMYLNSKFRSKAWAMSALFLLGLSVARIRSTRVVWTVHNVKPHQIKFPIASKIFWFFFPKLVDGYISLAKSLVGQIEDAYPLFKRLPSAVIPHGLYQGEYPPSVGKVEARRRLSFKETGSIVLHFGRVMGYKNAPGLIEAFRRADKRGLIDAQLIVAGKIDMDCSASVVEAARGAKNVQIVDAFITNEKLADLISAADLCVLPYKKVSNSGSVLLAATYQTPCLVPRLANFEEISQSLGTNCMFFFDGDIEAKDIIRGLNLAGTADFSSAPRALAWDNIAGATRDFFQKLAAPKGKF